MPSARQLRVFPLLIACAASALSCATPQSHEEATGQLALKGIIRPVPNTADQFVFGPSLLMETSVTDAAGICNGAMGSILPPLSRDVPSAALVVPFEAVRDVLGSDHDPSKKEVSLEGIERSWVRQSDPSGCEVLWKRREILHLHRVSQKEIQALVSKECKQLQTQKGAEAFRVSTRALGFPTSMTTAGLPGVL